MHPKNVFYYFFKEIFNYCCEFLQEQAQSVCFSPDGSIMVVGCVSGKWLAIDSGTRELYSHHSDGSEPLQVRSSSSHDDISNGKISLIILIVCSQVVSFSPNGTLLALGSRDNYIYIYQVNEDATKYSRVGRCMVS